MEYEEYYQKTNYLEKMRQRTEQLEAVRNAQEILGLTEILKDQSLVVGEVNRELHVSLYGSVPSLGNPTIDTLAQIGCPCTMCFRSDFL